MIKTNNLGKKLSFLTLFVVGEGVRFEKAGQR